MIDTKSDTKNDPESLVIYPAKSEIGMMSKTYLELINNKIREKRQVNKWHSTKSVLQ